MPGHERLGLPVADDEQLRRPGRPAELGLAVLLLLDDGAEPTGAAVRPRRRGDDRDQRAAARARARSATMARTARDQLPAVLLGVGQRLVAADQQGRRPDLDVRGQCFGHRLRRADERRRVAPGAGGGGQRGPQAAVEHLGPGRRVEQALRRHVRRRRGRRGLARRLHDVEEPVGPVPRRTFGGGQDRSGRDAEPGSAVAGGGPHPGEELGRLGQRLAPHHERVDLRRQLLDGVVGPTAAVDRDRRPVPGRDVRHRPLDPVEVAVVVERRPGRPRLAEHPDVLGRAAVPVAVVGEVAVAGLVGVAAAADDVHGGPAPAELVERGELAGRQRRGHEPGAVGHEQAQALRGRGHVGADEEPVGGVREVADQHAVEAGGLVDLGRAGEHVGVEDRAAGAMISDDSCGAAQPMSSTSPESSNVVGLCVSVMGSPCSWRDRAASSRPRRPRPSRIVSSCGVWTRPWRALRRWRSSGLVRSRPGLPTRRTASRAMSIAAFVTVSLTRLARPATSTGSPPASTAAAASRSSPSPSSSWAAMRPNDSWKRGSEASGAPRFDGTRSLR